MHRIILATDMAYHDSILNSFNAIVHDFSYSQEDHRLQVTSLNRLNKIRKKNINLNFFNFVQLMKILMKVSDISNEGRPVKVSEQWLDCLLLEFFNQVDQIFYLIHLKTNKNLFIFEK